ncbi:hypothetical protein V8F20_008120 [Naviculisporaceae sp. PSN 640]
MTRIGFLFLSLFCRHECSTIDYCLWHRNTASSRQHVLAINCSQDAGRRIALDGKLSGARNSSRFQLHCCLGWGASERGQAHYWNAHPVFLASRQQNGDIGSVDLYISSE